MTGLLTAGIIGLVILWGAIATIVALTAVLFVVVQKPIESAGNASATPGLAS